LRHPGSIGRRSSIGRDLTDNGASYIATDLAKWLDGQGMEHVRGTPYHPRTQGKIERWHQTLKNRILLEKYYLPGDLEREIKASADPRRRRGSRPTRKDAAAVTRTCSIIAD
jgi:transposase InsO family protein